MTTYVVLSRNGEGWQQLADTYEAVGDQDAIRKALRHTAGADGEYVAVPIRSFHIRKVVSETRTVLTFSDNVEAASALG